MASGKKKILIIDDDPDYVISTKAILGGANYETISAPDGKTGVAKAEDEQPDLILIDIMMETWGAGFNVVDKLRKSEKTKNIPVIMISAVDLVGEMTPYPGEEWVKSADVMLKPIKKDDLLDNVSRFLEVS